MMMSVVNIYSDTPAEHFAYEHASLELSLQGSSFVALQIFYIRKLTLLNLITNASLMDKIYEYMWLSKVNRKKKCHYLQEYI